MSYSPILPLRSPTKLFPARLRRHANPELLIIDEFGPGMLITYDGGWSSYNALTAKIEKRFSQGFYLLGSYTWQKSLDLGATNESSTIATEYKKWDKGRSTVRRSAPIRR